jgi:hypothetical protein
LLSGGRAIGRSRLNDFRQRHGALFAGLIEQTVAMAQKSGLLAFDELAADSVRLRAHASTKNVRTLARSKKRLEELALVDESTLSESERETHQAKLDKHRKAVTECEQRGRTNIITTNPSAGLMKFPDGAGLPGHRVTAMAAGVQERLVISVLITADTNDYGRLEAIVDAAVATLGRVGVDEQTRLSIAADAGYCAQTDLAFAERVRERMDVLIDGTHALETRSRFFGRDRFVIRDDGTALCPAGRLMKGPTRQSDDRTLWRGVGCTDCAMRADCTESRERKLTVNLDLERLRAAMSAKLDTPDGKQRYNRRIATVEPVFSNLESTMGYRRVSSRNEQTIVAEILLKVLSHNISRLFAAKRLLRVFCLVAADGLHPLRYE